MLTRDFLVTIPHGDRKMGILDITDHEHNSLLELISNNRNHSNRVLDWILETLKDTDDEIWLVSSGESLENLMRLVEANSEAFSEAVKETGRQLR